jgi:hypothetical protein
MAEMDAGAARYPTPDAMAQVFFQDGSFDLKLMFVVSVLIVASATALKVGASGIDAPGRGGKNPVQLSAHESGLLFPKSCRHSFAGQDKRDKYGSARTAIVGGKPRQPVPAINQFLDVESQASILQDGAVV